MHGDEIAFIFGGGKILLSLYDYHIVSYHIVSRHIISYRIISYHCNIYHRGISNFFMRIIMILLHAHLPKPKSFDSLYFREIF